MLVPRCWLSFLLLERLVLHRVQKKKKAKQIGDDDSPNKDRVWEGQFPGRLMKEAPVAPAMLYILIRVMVKWVCLAKLFELDTYGLFIFMYVLSFS